MVIDDPRNSQGMNRWITDRLPTEADVDILGNVRIPLHPRDSMNGMVGILRRYYPAPLIKLGEPWFPNDAAYFDAAVACEEGPVPVETEPAAADLAPAETEPTTPEPGVVISPVNPPTFQEIYAEAELEHLRAKTAVLLAQAEYAQIKISSLRVEAC